MTRQEQNDRVGMSKHLPTLAYLVGDYPSRSQTFILREVEQLRLLGFSIHTASINRPKWRDDRVGLAEEREISSTFYVASRSMLRIAFDHARTFLSRPINYLAALWFAVWLAGSDFFLMLSNLFYFGEAVVLGSWMRSNQLQHVHVHHANATSLVALIAKRLFGITYSFTVHGPTEFFGIRSYRLREKIEGAEFVCCISSFCRSQLMKCCHVDQWNKFELCPLGVDPEQFPPRPVPSNRPSCLLCIGRLVPDKAQIILLQVLTRLRGKGYDLELVLVGNGPDRLLLEQMASQVGILPSVTFAGEVRQERIVDFLRAADLFIQPSFAEGVPVALMEAMAMEVPSIASAVGGITELISSGEDGIVVPASDIDSLEATIALLLDNPYLRDSIGKAGRQKVLKQYNLKTNVERLASIYETRLGFVRHLSSPVSSPRVVSHQYPLV